MIKYYSKVYIIVIIIIKVPARRLEMLQLLMILK